MSTILEQYSISFSYIKGEYLIINPIDVNFSQKYNMETAWMSLLICTKHIRVLLPNKEVCARANIDELARLWKRTKRTVRRWLDSFKEWGFISINTNLTGDVSIKFNKWVLFNGRMV